MRHALTCVVDASVVVAALTSTNPDGAWAESLLANDELLAPHLLPAEVVSMLRRATAIGDLSIDAAARAQTRLLDLRAELHPYAPFAERIWELRGNLTPYDAWYVAIAETFNVRLATVDGPLTRAPGVRCAFLTPPGR